MYLLGIFSLLFFQASLIHASPDNPSEDVSEAAAKECLRKLNEMVTYAAGPETENGKITRFTEEEINSYLALYEESEYRSCLQYFNMSFRQGFMEGIVSVDFDCLKKASSKSLPKLLTTFFSGTHIITARGTILSDNGKGRFQLEEARFDALVLPGLIVEQLITTLCMQLDPPFDPMEPSPFPYKIKRVRIQPGYIMVFQ